MNINLVNIADFDERIVVDLIYATENNFTGRAVYDFNICLVLEPVAKGLVKVQKELENQGLGLKIWDGYRPPFVQEIFWEIIQDERYVAPPWKGGRHTRGTAVDVTIVDLEGNELAMPTPFDEFSERAHRGYDSNITNQLLESLMVKYGFVGLPTEWWHFDLIGWESYPVLPFPKDLLYNMK